MLTGPEGQRRLADVIDNAISYATRRGHPRTPAHAGDAEAGNGVPTDRSPGGHDAGPGCPRVVRRDDEPVEPGMGQTRSVSSAVVCAVTAALW